MLLFNINKGIFEGFLDGLDMWDFTYDMFCDMVRRGLLFTGIGDNAFENINLLNKIKLYYTTDLKQNDESLDESLVEFAKNEETGKFKMKNTKIKLLGE